MDAETFWRSSPRAIFLLSKQVRQLRARGKPSRNQEAGQPIQGQTVERRLTRLPHP